MTENKTMQHFSIDLFREGDQHAFKKIFEHFHNRIFLFTHSIVKAEDVAEDIVTESFVKLWKMREKFDKPENMKAFLYTVTRNAALDHLRQRKRQRAATKELLFLKEEDSSGPAQLERRVIEAEVINELSLQIEDLPGKCRDVFKLIYFKHLSTAQIAEELKISNQNVLNQKARAIELLRSRLMQKSLLELALLLPFLILLIP